MTPLKAQDQMLAAHIAATHGAIRTLVSLLEKKGVIEKGEYAKELGYYMRLMDCGPLEAMLLEEIQSQSSS